MMVASATTIVVGDDAVVFRGERRNKMSEVEGRANQVTQSIFVTNFPSGTSAKQLWDICEQYGKVVDSFIPARVSKEGKKFAFVRFSKVKNIEVLIGNLNTVWIGKFKLRFNVARFQMGEKFDGVKNGEQKQPVRFNVPSSSTFSRSFVAAVSNEARPCSLDKKMEDKPVMVIDDDCLTDKKFDLMLVAKVKSFDSMPNLGVVLKDEGFENVTIRYVGGFWVSMEFLDSHARDCFQKHEGLYTWFSVVQPWKTDFKVDERVLWIDVEGVPLVAWTNKNFIKIAKRWGDMLFSEDSEDNNLWRKRLCVVTKVEEFIMESFKIIIKGKVSTVRAREIIGWTPDFMEEDNDSSSDSGDDVRWMLRRVLVKRKMESEDLFKPPGFSNFVVEEKVASENDEGRVNSFNQVQENISNTKQNSNHVEIEQQVESNSNSVKGGRGSEKDSVLPKGKCPRNESSLLEKMNEFVEIGQTMGSDYFVLVEGVWKQTGTKLLMIGVYAPQDLSEKKLLWNYLHGVLSRWQGESIMMGDFNEVRVPSERHGSVFNKQGASMFNSFINSSSLIDVPLGGFLFTWAVKNATKMSKLDRFLVSEGLLCQFPAMMGIILTRHLSDHRPILLRECDIDYGPTPFKTFHSWFDIEGFDQMVKDAWNSEDVDDPNEMTYLKKKFQKLKKSIISWVHENRRKATERRKAIQDKLFKLDKQIDQEGGQEDLLNSIRVLWKDLRVLDDLRGKDLVQKAKVKWAIEGDENSKYFHGVMNKKDIN
ncbi:RNA-directed DNA polymerase, eukaryota [Tanacetum coccineum]